VTRFPGDDVFIAVLSNGRSDLGEVQKRIEALLFPKPRTVAHIDVSPYEKGEIPVWEPEGPFEWRVASKGGPVLLTLRDGGKDHDLARIELPPEKARALADRLAAFLRAGHGRGGKGMAAGAYLQPYRLDDGVVDIGDGLDIELMPQYRGQDEDGSVVVDDRITFALVDGIRGQWPIMAKMDRASAEKLLEGLKRSSR
jgi:hypothetical protein